MITLKIYLRISLEQLRAVWGQFSFRQFLVPAYTSSQGLQALSNVVSANCRVLKSVAPVTSRSVPFSSFILASSVSKSLQCLISALTQGGAGGYFFRLTCSIVLWGGRNTANKYHWHVQGVLAMSGPRWVCPHSRRMLSQSTLLRLQVDLQGSCLRWTLGCMHFPHLSWSG